MARDEKTSARVASIAARGLRKPESLTLDEIKAVCATAMNQAPDRADKKPLMQRIFGKA